MSCALAVTWSGLIDRTPSLHLDLSAVNCLKIKHEYMASIPCRVKPTVHGWTELNLAPCHFHLSVFSYPDSPKNCFHFARNFWGIIFIAHFIPFSFLTYWMGKLRINSDLHFTCVVTFSTDTLKQHTQACCVQSKGFIACCNCFSCPWTTSVVVPCSCGAAAKSRTCSAHQWISWIELLLWPTADICPPQQDSLQGSTWVMILRTDTTASW